MTTTNARNLPMISRALRKNHAVPVKIAFTLPSKKVENDIGVPGLKHVLDSEAPWQRKLAWMLVIVVFTCLAIMQASERIIRFMSYPVNANMRYVRNESLKFPAITLCPYRTGLVNDVSHLDTRKLDRLWLQHFPNDDYVTKKADMYYRLADLYDVQTLWDLTSINYSDIIKDCWYTRGKPCKNLGSFQLIYTICGVCYHFRGPPSQLSGYSHEADNHGFYLAVTEENESPDLKALTNGMYIEKGWNKDIHLALKELRTQDRPTKRCDTTNKITDTSCLVQCFHENVAKLAGCAMPYMKNLTLHGQQIFPCNTSNSLLRAELVQKKLLWEGEWKAKECKCDRPACLQYIIDTYMDSSERPDNCSRYKVYYGDMSFQETSEEFSYSIVALLCDIGGTLGLLLGASVLTLFQIIDYTIARLWLSAKGSKTTSKTRTQYPKRSLVYE